MTGTPMRLEKGENGLSFTLPVDVADSIGLAEGDDVTVRATSDGRMELVRVLGDTSQEVIAIFGFDRNGRDAT